MDSNQIEQQHNHDNHTNCPKTTLEQNRDIVLDFYLNGVSKKNFDVIDKYVGNEYRQHNPNLSDGKDALKAWLTKRKMEMGPIVPQLEIIRTIAQDDLVCTHSKLTIGQMSFAVSDIFRIKCGKVVEHWDVKQEMKESSVNDHAYF